MIINMVRTKYILSLFLLALNTLCFAQGRVEAQLDSMTIVIGGQVGFNVSASYPENMPVAYKQLSDSLTKDVEIVTALPIDTTVQNGIVQLVQRYIVTSFDSGLHYIPPIEILEFEDGHKVTTSDMALNVVNPFQNIVVDEETHTVEIFDVKDVKNTPFSFGELLQYLPWIIIGLLLIAAVVAGIWYYRKYLARKSGEEPAEVKNIEPCDVVALRELEQIRVEKIWQKNQFKEYYSSITDTLRKYVSERYGISAMESTTDEIMADLRGALSDDTQSRDRLKNILEEADFVKFAKYEPLPDENDMAIKYAIDFVSKTREERASNEGSESGEKTVTNNE